MNTFIFLKSPKRSGQHLFINWVTWHYKSYIHYNDMWPYRTDFNPYIIRTMLSSKKDLTITNLENPHKMKCGDNKIILDEISKRFQRWYSIFLLRDPLNWAASSLCKMLWGKPGWKEAVIKRYNTGGCWKVYRTVFPMWLKEDIRVTFNDFIKSKDYRIQLASRIGIKFDDNIDEDALGTQATHKAVFPSSTFDNDASSKLTPKEMKVLERYKNISFLDFPQDMIKIGKEYFGIDYEL